MYRFSFLVKFILSIIALPSILQSASSSSLHFTIEDAVAFALSNNKALIAAQSTIAQAKAHHHHVGKWENPELSLEYASDWAFNDAGESMFGIGFAQKFPITQRLRLLKDIAFIEIKLAEAEIKNQQRLLTRAVEIAWFNIAEIEAQLALRNASIELNEKFAEFIEAKINTGEKSAVDANQIKIELFAIKQVIQTLENQLAEETAVLKSLLGVTIETDLHRILDFALPASEPTLPHVNTAMLEAHPEYQLKSLLYEIADKQTSLAIAERWDDITVKVFFQNERSVDAPNGLDTDRFFGLSVSIPLPIINQNHDTIHERRSYRRQMKLSIDAVLLDINNRAKTLRQKATSLYQQAHDYDKNITSIVEQNLKDINTAYSSGQINLTELFRAQEQSLKLESTYLTMLHDYKIAWLDWKAMTAQNLNFIENNYSDEE